MKDFRGMKRQRSRNRKPAGNQTNNPNRAYESNGPEGSKVRGNAQTIYERYQQLARDANSSGDRVLAENYLQHAEHYFRLIRQMQPQRPVSEFLQRDPFSTGFDFDEDLDVDTEAQDGQDQSDDADNADTQGDDTQDNRRDKDRYRDRDRDRDNRNRDRNNRDRDNRDRDNRDNRDRDNRDRDYRDRPERIASDRAVSELAPEDRQAQRQNSDREPREFRDVREPREPRESQRESKDPYEASDGDYGSRRESRRERYERRRLQRLGEQEAVAVSGHIASTEPLGLSQAPIAPEEPLKIPEPTLAPKLEKAPRVPRQPKLPVEDFAQDTAHLPAFLRAPVSGSADITTGLSDTSEPEAPKRGRPKRKVSAE